MEYTLKSIKTFRGMDGQGMNATLYRDGVKVALVIDDGCGGEIHLEWVDYQAPRVTVPWVNYEGQPCEIRCTPEASKLYEFLRGKTWNIGKMFGKADKEIQVDIGIFIGELADKTINENRFKRLCKSKTLFRLKTDEKDCWRTLKSPFNQQVKDLIMREFGSQVESIMNEMLTS